METSKVHVYVHVVLYMYYRECVGGVDVNSSQYKDYTM